MRIVQLLLCAAVPFLLTAHASAVAQDLPTCTDSTPDTDFEKLVTIAFDADVADLDEGDYATLQGLFRGNAGGTRQAFVNGKLTDDDNTVFGEARAEALTLGDVDRADFENAFLTFTRKYTTSAGGRAYLADLIPTVEMNVPGMLENVTRALYLTREEFACRTNDGLSLEQIQRIDLASATELNAPLVELSTDDMLKPRVFPSPAGGWNNDPYIVYDSRNNLHIFYQLNPFAINWGHIHWGHMVIPADRPGSLSRRPIALEPRPDEGYVHCFSGSLLANKIPDPAGGDGEVTAAFFTATGTGEGDYVSFLGAPPVVMAVSADRDLNTWNALRYQVTGSEVYLNKVDTINGNDPVANRYNIRDPVVFQRDGHYFMIQAGTAIPDSVGSGVIVLLRPSYADNLSEPWDYVGDMFRHPQPDLADGGPGTLETPTLQRVGTKDVLLFGAQRRDGNLRNFHHNQAVQYFVGTFNSSSGAFVADSTEPHYFEYGRAAYAMSAQPRPTFEGELANERGAESTLFAWILGYDGSAEWSSEARGWQGALYLPMTMSLGDHDGALSVAPDERVLTAKRVTPAIHDCTETFVVKDGDVVVTNVNERTFELQTTIALDPIPGDATAGTERSATIEVLSDGENSIAITYNGEEIRIDDEALPVGDESDLDGGASSVEVTVVVDRMIIGVYAGGKMLHKVINPPRTTAGDEYASGVRFSAATGTSGEFASVCAWRLQTTP